MKLGRLSRKSIAVILAVVVLLIWAIPMLGRYCLAQAESKLQQGSWRSAETWMRRAELLPSDVSEWQFLETRMSRKLGRTAAFDSGLQKCLEVGVDPARVQREFWLFEAQTGNLDNLESNLSRLLVKGEDLQEICEAFAVGCILNYRLDDALNIIGLWEADFPKDAQPQFLRGRLLEHRSNVAGAIDAYQAALEFNPQHSAAAYNLGRTLLLNQQPEQAIPYFELCAETLHEPLPGLVGLAQCARELGRLDQAEEYLQTAEARPDDLVEEAFRLVGESRESARTKLPGERGQLALAREDYAAAIAHFQQALEFNPREWRLRYHLGTALCEAGREDEAAAEIRRFQETNQALATCDTLIDRLKREPDDVEARYQIGRVMLENVSANQGLVWLNSVLKYDPQHVPTHALLAKYFAEHADEHPSFPELARQHAAQATSTQEAGHEQPATSIAVP